MAHPKVKKVRLVQVDPETRDAVTTEFNSLEELVIWANKELNRTQIEVKSEE